MSPLAPELDAVDELSFDDEEPESLLDDSFEPDSEPVDEDELDADDGLGPFADELDDRESVIYHPLPLNTMPTG